MTTPTQPTPWRNLERRIQARALFLNEETAAEAIRSLRQAGYRLVERGHGINTDAIMFGDHDWGLNRAPLGSYLVFEGLRVRVFSEQAFNEFGYLHVDAPHPAFDPERPQS